MKNYLLSIKKKSYRILLAPNAFKGSLKAWEFCQILSEELQHPTCSVLSFPMCDGGDGTACILASYLHATPVSFPTTDALGHPHEIVFYIYGETAIVDLASICGLQHLKPQEYDVYNTNTAGLGKILFYLSQQNICHIILGVGGSASIDGGLGAFKEMGMTIVKDGQKYLNHLLELKGMGFNRFKESFKHIKWTILCDVENRLCGEEGASVVFGPQKGATPQQIRFLDQKLNDYGALLSNATGKDILSLKYGGAAGGIAAAFHAILDAELISGADYCLEVSQFLQQLPEANLVITGEGKLDAQSLNGKLPGVISTHCQQHHVPVIGIAGSIAPPLPDFKQVYCLLDYATDLDDAIQHSKYYLRRIAKDLKRDFLKL